VKRLIITTKGRPHAWGIVCEASVGGNNAGIVAKRRETGLGSLCMYVCMYVCTYIHTYIQSGGGYHVLCHKALIPVGAVQLCRTLRRIELKASKLYRQRGMFVNCRFETLVFEVWMNYISNKNE
jgi:hypothetical protein